jgi:IS5 family transposase
VFRTVDDQLSLWESLLPEEEVLQRPEELGRVDALLDGPAFPALFARISTP